MWLDQSVQCSKRRRRHDTLPVSVETSFNVADSIRLTISYFRPLSCVEYTEITTTNFWTQARRKAMLRNDAS